jgi:hypothetical protein
MVASEDQRKVAMKFSENPPNAFWKCRIGALLQINQALGGGKRAEVFSWQL